MHYPFMEVSIMDSHQTKDDAREQFVFRGSMGSLAGNCSREYLMHLRADCYAWIARLEEALAEIDAEEARLEELENDDGDEDDGGRS
jgi:hypothetical protein